MSKTFFPIGRVFVVDATNDGDFGEFGAGAGASEVGLVAVQFNPDVDFVGSFSVVGRAMGQDAKDADVPFLPIPYVRVNVNGAASDRAIVSAAITGPGIIEIPANGQSVGLLIGCSAGTCTVFPIRLAGTPGSL